MNKKEIINKINEIIMFLTNGIVKTNNNNIYKGHPCFYLLHSKQEFNNKLKEIIVDKEIKLTLDDYLNQNDTVMNYAINALKESRKII